MRSQAVTNEAGRCERSGMAGRFAGVVLGAVLAAGCTGGGAGGGGGGGGSIEEAQGFSVVDEGTQTGYRSTGALLQAGAEVTRDGDDALLLLDSPGALQAFWTAHAGDGPAAPARPAVDLSREVLVAAMLGPRPGGAGGVEVSHVGRDRWTGALTVEVSEDDPATASSSAAVSRPYAMVRTARPPARAWPAPVTFRRFWRLRFDTVAQGGHSCYGGSAEVTSSRAGPVLLAFRDAASWRAFWARHACGSLTPPPAIDFTRQMAIAYLAARGSDATAVTIERVLYDRRRRIIVVRVLEGSDPVTTAERRRPFHIVRCRAVPGRLVLRSGRRFPIRTLDRGAVSGYRYGDPGFGGENLTVREEGRYRWLWKEHTKNRVPPPPPPPVGFPREMVLASFFGTWPTSGASVEIVSARRTWFGALRVDVVKRARPGPLQVVTNPYHLTATRMWRGPVLFVEHWRR